MFDSVTEVLIVVVLVVIVFHIGKYAYNKYHGVENFGRSVQQTQRRTQPTQMQIGQPIQSSVVDNSGQQMQIGQPIQSSVVDNNGITGYVDATKQYERQETGYYPNVQGVDGFDVGNPLSLPNSYTCSQTCMGYPNAIQSTYNKQSKQCYCKTAHILKQVNNDWETIFFK